MWSIELNTDQNILSLIPIKDAENEDQYNLIDDSSKHWIVIKLKGREFEIKEQDNTIINSPDEINAKLGQLVLDIIETEQSGTENTETDSDQGSEPYDPDDIKVSFKQFSIKLIKELVESNDLDLNPDFQRHFVWDRRRRSRLIESILLRIPLPMFYFSEDKEGRLTIVDGLQRITTINDFMDNKFPLKDLEYLKDSCEGKYYKTLDPKYARWFNQTQIAGNVIDPSSPYKVKYDIFKRINTGGKSLNNQEIRNCLSGKTLRKVLHKMVLLPEFKRVTDNSIKSIRMNDEEMALRFILFRLFKSDEKGIETYNGYMDIWLDYLTETYYNAEENELSHYISEFSTAMKNSDYLIGSKYAFRKIQKKNLNPEAHKQLINKALFVSCSVLLADYEYEKVVENNERNALLNPLIEAIETDFKFKNYLSYGTNGKANMLYAFSTIEKIIRDNLKY